VVIGVFPAQLDGGDASVSIGAEGDGVKGGGTVHGADIAESATATAVVARILIHTGGLYTPSVINSECHPTPICGENPAKSRYLLRILT